MTNGEEKDRNKTGRGESGDRADRRRRAVRPAVIEGEAREIAEETATETATETAAPGDETSEVTGEAAEETTPADAGPTETTAETTPETTSQPTAAADESGPEETTPDAPAEGDEETREGAFSGEEAATDQAESARTAPLPTARRASVIAAGIVGAVLALGVYLGLDYLRILPRAGASNAELTNIVNEMDRRLTGIETSIARAAKRDNSKVIAGRIADLESSLKEIGADPRNSLVRRMSDAETKIDAMAETAAASPAAKDLDERLTYVEDKLADIGTGAASAAGEIGGNIEQRLADLEKRLGGVEARPAVVTPDGKPVDDAAVKALTDRIAALNAQMTEMSDTVAALGKTVSTQSAGRLTEIDSTLSALRGALDTLSGDVDAKLAKLEKTVSEGASGEARQMARTTAGALAVTALERTVDEGKPYTAELDVLRPLVGDKADLSALDAHAGTGVADLATLQAEFATTANAILSAGAPADSGPDDSGIVGSLLDSARTLVRVRPTGKVEGSGRGAIVARIEAALNAGDLKTAAGEWDTLDDSAKAASKDWADALKARIAVNSALADLSAALNASLSGAAASN
ncbi:COG4223 family protein [Microbaculum sp. FT89]|uniref:COG4223 family protein n=1 Tax=Microbaculum sp. FT89 TaxID=3447298 RepID=UPI003F531C80